MSAKGLAYRNWRKRFAYYPVVLEIYNNKKKKKKKKKKKEEGNNQYDS